MTSFFNDTFLSRRKLLRHFGVLSTATAALANLGIDGIVGRQGTQAEAAIGISPRLRRNQAFNRRQDAANQARSQFSIDHPDNGDEVLYTSQGYISSFTKALPHLQSGVVDSNAYLTLLKALAIGKFDALETVPLGGTVKLANPLGAYTFGLEGQDSHGLTMVAAPAFNSAQQASEMVELYWQALTRDVPFSSFNTDFLTNAAVDDLNHCSDFQGPKESGLVTTQTLFRAGLPGETAGPLISQFLWLNVPQAPFFPLAQKIRTAQSGIDYMTNSTEWLAIQNGVPPTTAFTFDSAPRYIRNGRDLGEYVHRDYPYQAFVNACLILLSYGSAALDANNPYPAALKQGGFVNFGAPDILDLVARVAREALKAAWFQKWLVHRRLRPEAFGGWVDNQVAGRGTYPIQADLLNSSVLSQIFSRTGNYLLPIAYAEGCPVHPSYPAGHATYAGACVTVLKAYFNESFIIPNPVVASDDGLSLLTYSGSESLTLGGELNKLASNISLGRDTAGVHWRTDCIDGLLIGEQVALNVLSQFKRLYPEAFSGFSLTRFDGTTAKV